MKKLFERICSVFCSILLIAGTIPLTSYAAGSYTVTFDANGGYLYDSAGQTQYNQISYQTDNNNSVTVSYPFNYDGKTYSIARPGYELSGWSDGNNTITLDTTNTFNLTKNVIYSAVWVGKTYQATFYDNNGLDGPGTILGTKTLQVGSDQLMTLSALGVDAPSDDNVFIGWDLTSGTSSYFFDGYNDSSAVYDFLDASGNPIFDTDEVTLRAVTIPTSDLTITVSYDANGGGGTISDSTFTYGEQVTLSTANNRISRNNYTFAGWSTDPNARQAMFVDSQTSKMNFGLREDTTLYAVWTSNSSTAGSKVLHFVENHIQTASGTTKYTNYNDKALTNTPTKVYDGSVTGIPSNTLQQKGYYVSGWRLVQIDTTGAITKKSTQYNASSYFSVDSTGTYVVITDSTKTYLEKIADYADANNELYLYPEWTPITLKLAYAPNAGGSGSAPANMVISVDTDTTLAANTFTHSTKAFMGWSMDPSATADKMYSSGASATTDMTYPAGYNVRSSVNSQQSYSLFSDPFSKYLDVTNWDSAFMTSTYFDNTTGILDLTSLSSYKIYAIWDDNTYTVHFDANNGSIAGLSGKMSDQVISVTAETALTSNGFALTGYDFNGWSTTSDGSGPWYDDEAVVKGLAARNETITLYAQWELSDVDTVPLIINQVWDDNSDQDGARPGSVTYTLSATANGTVLKASDIGLDAMTFTVNSSESSTQVASIPLKYLTASGTYQTIVYKLTAMTITGYTYTTSLTTDSSGVTGVFTYSHTPATMSYSVTIKMSDSDDQDGMRPKSISLTLKGSDGSSKTVTVTISGSSNSYTFENLPVYAKGSAITYTASVGSISNYTVSSSISNTSTTFTCSHTPETTSTSIKVTWKDNDNAGKTRPATIKTTLQLSNGKSMNSSISATVNSASLTNIAKYYQGNAVTGVLTVTPVTSYTATVTGSLTSGFTVTMTLTDVAKSAAANTASSAGSKNSSTTGNTKKSGASSTSTSVKDDKNIRTIKVSTIWNDNNSDYLRPLAVKISLVGSDGNSYDKVLMNTTGWVATFADVPVRDETTGETVEYKIKYSPISSYTTHVYHNRKDQDEFIIEHFLPSNDASAAALAETGTLIAPTTEDNDNKIVVGGVETDTLLQADSEGNPLTDTSDNGDYPLEEDPLTSQIMWNKYLIPGILGGGIFAVLLAVILALRNSKK
ncbi:MAG: Cna B-type domain-containing protein [Butyrivibrio sp.]|nr:Cna B-type domain-containing protein [Butyrivibrio sp.]